MKKRRVLSKVTVWAVAICLLLSLTPLTVSATDISSVQENVNALEAMTTSLEIADIDESSITALADNTITPLPVGSSIHGIIDKSNIYYNINLASAGNLKITLDHDIYAVDDEYFCKIYLKNQNGNTLTDRATFSGGGTSGGYLYIYPYNTPAYEIFTGLAAGTYTLCIESSFYADSLFIGRSDVGLRNRASYAISAEYVSVVTFNSNGGDQSEYKQYYAPGKPYAASLSFPFPTPTRNGYAFTGWYTDRNAGSEVTGSTVAPYESVKYYAHWKQTTATITFDAGGGSLSASDRTRSVSIGSAIGTLPIPSRSSYYTFTGWFTSPSGGYQISANTVVTADATYYAQWVRRGPATGAQFSCYIMDKTYTGGNQGISVTPHYGVGRATVYYTGVSGTKYRKSTNRPKNIGTYRVTVDAASGSGYDAASGIVLGSFKIVPKSPGISKVTAGKKQMSVKWKKISAAQKPVKYQMRYRATGTSKWKTKSYGASVTSATIKGLKKGRAYEVQTRSLSKVNGRNYYSQWSKSKTSKKLR